jgi:hypothetical protein
MMAIAAVGWLGLASASDVTIELTDGGADVGALLRLPMPAEILKAKAGQVVELTDEKGVAVQAQVECAGTEGNGLELVLVRPAGLGKRLKVGNVSSPNLDGLYTVTKEGDQTVALCAGQKLMAVYRLGVRTLAGHPEHNRANFFYPLLTPAGAIVNDDAPADHLHHRGLFLAFTELTWAGDGKQLKGNFWHKDANAVIAPGQLHYARGGPVCATLAASHDFMIGGQTVVVQDVIARAARVSDRVHVLDVEYRITPKNGDVVLGENFYSCLQLRGAANFNRPDLVFSYSDGIPHRDVDKRKEQPPEDPPFERWLDETGLLNGSPVGTAIAVHPSVPKSRLCYSRGVKGLNLDFLYNGPMLVKAGETVRARYQVYLHDGTAADARIGDLAGWFNPGIEANWKK